MKGIKTKFMPSLVDNIIVGIQEQLKNIMKQEKKMN